VTRIKVCYISGYGRSGSTLLGQVLGHVEGFCNVGEVRNLFETFRRPGWRCGCGEVLVECPFWKEVLASGTPPISSVDPETVHALWRSSFRTRHVPRLWWDAVRHRQPVPEYAQILDRLYQGLAETSGAAVLVDGSKRPADALIAHGLDDVYLYLVHMVRDPRAVAYSWTRDKPSPGGLGDGARMGRRRPDVSTREWLFFNAAFMTVVRASVGRRRYMPVHYEDLVREPRATTAAIVEFLGERPIGLPFVDDHTVELRATHNASGNPNRFQTGPVEIRLDDEWRRAMSPRDRRVATLWSAPLLPLLGYPFRP